MDSNGRLEWRRKQCLKSYSGVIKYNGTEVMDSIVIWYLYFYKLIEHFYQKKSLVPVTRRVNSGNSYIKTYYIETKMKSICKFLFIYTWNQPWVCHICMSCFWWVNLTLKWTLLCIVVYIDAWDIVVWLKKEMTKSPSSNMQIIWHMILL